MIHGLKRVPKFIHTDARGRFEKFFSGGEESLDGIYWRESFSSVSQTGTIRGMHLQAPPYEHYRLVSCSEGQILDVCIDLRLGSPTQLEVHSETLDAQSAHSLLIPPGIAHGFAVTSGPARVVYFSTSEYSAQHDTGVAWDSIGFNWGIVSPTISSRDRQLSTLKLFESPFEFRV